MSLDEYLKQNIKADILKKVTEFQNSSNYKSIKVFTLSDKYQTARMQLKIRDKKIHTSTLVDIQRLEDNLVVNG